MKETTAAFDLFMKNPYWRGVYENAPSGALKEYYRRSFEESGSWFLGIDAPTYDTEVKLTVEDLRYVLNNTAGGMARAMLKKRISELEKRQADENNKQ